MTTGISAAVTGVTPSFTRDSAIATIAIIAATAHSAPTVTNITTTAQERVNDDASHNLKRKSIESFEMRKKNGILNFILLLDIIL